MVFLNEERKNKGNFVKQKRQRIPVKKIKKTIIEPFETKPDKYEIVEYETIEPEPKEIEAVEKKTDEKTVEKIFDLPLINAVYNDWLEKKLNEKKNLETKMRINIQQHKYEIVEYETIEPEPI